MPSSRNRKLKPAPQALPAPEIVILAGGASLRMGSDKSRLRLGRRTLLAIIRGEARQVTPRVRVLRIDRIPRCGPLGGILTALESSTAARLIFLACDMPFISARTLRQLAARKNPAVATLHGDRHGFPLLLHRSTAPVVAAQIAAGQYSLQALCHVLPASTWRPTRSQAAELFNINTPADWTEARRRLSPPNRRDTGRRKG